MFAKHWLSNLLGSLEVTSERDQGEFLVYVFPNRSSDIPARRVVSVDSPNRAAVRFDDTLVQTRYGTAIDVLYELPFGRLFSCVYIKPEQSTKQTTLPFVPPKPAELRGEHSALGLKAQRNLLDHYH